MSSMSLANMAGAWFESMSQYPYNIARNDTAKRAVRMDNSFFIISAYYTENPPFKSKAAKSAPTDKRSRITPQA